MNQLSFSRLWDGYTTDNEAKAARNAKAKELRAQGKQVNAWVLRNQLKKYDGLGQPNGLSCNVYMLNVYP